MVTSQVEHIMLCTRDPVERVLEGNSSTVPALTSLLYRVCDNDPDKFEEACRLVQLFIEAALDHQP